MRAVVEEDVSLCFWSAREGKRILTYVFGIGDSSVRGGCGIDLLALSYMRSACCSLGADVRELQAMGRFADPRYTVEDIAPFCQKSALDPVRRIREAET